MISIHTEWGHLPKYYHHSRHTICFQLTRFIYLKSKIAPYLNMRFTYTLALISHGILAHIQTYVRHIKVIDWWLQPPWSSTPMFCLLYHRHCIVKTGPYTPVISGQYFNKIQQWQKCQSDGDTQIFYGRSWSTVAMLPGSVMIWQQWPPAAPPAAIRGTPVFVLCFWNQDVLSFKM